MIYRHDLTQHFDWLAGSKYFDEQLDESLVAIALCSHGNDDLVNWGASWMIAGDFVYKFDLEDFVARARSELILPPEPEADRYRPLGRLRDTGPPPPAELRTTARHHGG